MNGAERGPSLDARRRASTAARQPRARDSFP